MRVNRTERGWPGHFICAQDCMYRRNTLLQGNGRNVIVSSVGSMRRKGDAGLETIGASGRYYETMVFEAKLEGEYYEVDVGKELSINSPWSICADDYKNLSDYVDNDADKMHEAVVAEITELLEH